MLATSGEPSVIFEHAFEEGGARSVVEEAMRRLVTVDLADVPAGAALFVALSRRPGVADQDEHDLLETLAAQESAIAALHAGQVEVLAEFGRRRRGQYDDDSDAPTPPRNRKDFAADELTARLRWTAWTAAHRLDEAERLATCLPRTWTALDAGLLDYARVRRIVTATRMLSEDQAAAVDAAVADRAQGLTTGQLDELLATEITAVDAQAAEQRAARATAARSVRVAAQPDGQAQLLAEGPAADVLTVIRALTAAAGPPRPGDERGIDARRFDALRDWARTALSASGSGSSSDGSSAAWRPSVLLTVGLGTVLRLDDEPGHLHGYGPVPAHIARQITADGTLRRVLTDPVTGVLVGVDGHTHPGGLRADPSPRPAS